MAQARDRGFLWRISKQGKSSYLYGTIHIARKEWMFPGPQTVAALKASTVVALELDFTDTELMQRLQGGMLAQAARPESALPDDLAQRLAARPCTPPACRPRRCTPCAPEMLGALLVMMSARRDGLDASYGIDPALAQLARQQLKTVISLETPEQQLELMRSTTPAEQREGLREDARRPGARPHAAGAAACGPGVGRRPRRRAGALPRVVRLRQHRARAQGAEGPARRPQHRDGGAHRCLARPVASPSSRRWAACTCSARRPCRR